MKKIGLKEKLFTIFLFALVSVLSLQISLTTLIGSKARFTLFDFFAPTIGIFTGVIPGVAVVLTVQTANTLLHGGFSDAGSFIRLFPTLFAVIYFARPKKTLLFIPLLAILAFNLHPTGQTVWYYSLFWIIPLIAFIFRRFLILKSLGATFTAHSVGGAIWIWTFNLPAEVWQSLIPVVILERTVFALGISAIYVIFTHILIFLKENGIIIPFIHYPGLKAKAQIAHTD